MEPLSASEHIDQLNRLISSLRSQLQEKSAHTSDTHSLKPTATEPDLGSLYAQQRSQKLGMRSGGEGRHLPRYLNQQDDIMRPQSIPPKDSRPAATTTTTSTSLKLKESAQGSAVEPVPMTAPALAAALVLTEASSSSSVRPEIKITPSSTFPSSSSVTKEGGKTLSGTGVMYAPTTDAIHPTVAVKAVVPPKKIMKLVGQAVKEWSMIEEGDCLLLGLSGGKDSLALLHILLALQVCIEKRYPSLHPVKVK